MIGANLVRAGGLAALVIAVAGGVASIWMLYAVAFAVGAAETLYDTSAQSILPLIVGRDRLPGANGWLFAVELLANQFAGPPLGGVLVAVGATAALFTPAGSWLLAIGLLLLVRGGFRVRTQVRTTLRADIAEGLRYLWRDRLLRMFAVMVGTSNFASNAVFAVFVLYAVGPDSAMRLSEPEYGILLAALAVGSLAGCLLAARVERLLGRARALGLTVIGFAVAVTTPAVTGDARAVAAAFALGGAGIGIGMWNVIVVSLRQRITPDALLGRLNSAFRLVAWGTIPLGSAVGGLLAEAVGLRATFALAGLLVLAQLAGMRRVTDSAMWAAESRAVPADGR